VEKERIHLVGMILNYYEKERSVSWNRGDVVNSLPLLHGFDISISFINSSQSTHQSRLIPQNEYRLLIPLLGLFGKMNIKIVQRHAEYQPDFMICHALIQSVP
jgi:hypothetical protein